MPEKLVIDTNVAISANGVNTHASWACRLACIELLQDCKNRQIAIDKPGLIMDEYQRHLSYAGQPGVGDMFFKYLHDNQYSTHNILMVNITPSDDDRKGFTELPDNHLDMSDRKFLATAVVAKATLVNATDSDWTEQSGLLDDLGITIKQLCPEHSCK
ncbi:hypothetical protein [Methylovulum psychrotolerans]|uniref:PIN domain-containing protein n=1 Tax=Methylovulum psychrotolerans TaxID=1704499 RepID=A0A2S5CN71_9GAMM|nr:hypothetical protein [Methylovulum psychrotolerans]POZ52228.1 hypothetical protein AADEFJLK_01702 [Methylovulum psychrotolerans]